MPDKWIRPAKSTFAPRCIVSIVVETECRDRELSTGHYLHLPVRFHACEIQRPVDAWMAPLYISFTDGNSLFDWLELSSKSRRRRYVFTPDVFDTLTLSAFWKRIEQAGCKLMRDGARTPSRTDSDPPDQITGNSDPPLESVDLRSSCQQYHFTTVTPSVNTQIVKYRRFGRGYQWCSNVQYCRASEEEIAESIGYRWSLSADDARGLPNVIRTPYERCMMWGRFYQYLSDWWLANDGGPWGATVASCAYSFLRRRIPDKTILHHDDITAGAMEESAIFSGRRSVWYVGNIGSEDAWQKYDRHAPKRSEYGTLLCGAEHHDIRSMYPYLLSVQPYPIRHLDNITAPDIETVTELLQDYGVIASVTLNTDIDEYPYRDKSRVIFPIGQFRTTLCGAELMASLQLGHVQHVHAACIYELGYPFQDACEKLLAHRMEAKTPARKGWELFIKMLSNSMSGRIALVPRGWEPRPDMIPLHDWGYWSDSELGNEVINHYRSLAGMVWQSVILSEYNRPMGSAYAYLCSYGRYLMSVVRGMCPAGSVIAQDTDGIWCTDVASAALYGNRTRVPDGAGELNLTMYTPAARFYGPQHYWYGRGWVMSGHNVLTHRPQSDSILVRTLPLVIASSRQAPAAVRVEKIAQREVNRVCSPGEISADGWVQPILLGYTPGSDYDIES